MSDDLARFAALPYETRRAIIERLFDRVEKALADTRRELLGEGHWRGLRCYSCQQAALRTVDGLCALCAPPVPVEVPGSEWEERE